MQKLLRLLILEDDLETLSVLLKKLYVWEEKQSAKGKSLYVAVTIFSESSKVEKYLKNINKPTFDVILLDRDCKECGSFHVDNITKLDPTKIISISSVPEYNNDARRLGITNVVLKDYTNLEKFADEIINVLSHMYAQNSKST